MLKDQHDVELRHHEQKLEALGANVAELKGQFDSGLKDIHAAIKQFANQARPSQPTSSYNNKSSAAGTSRPTGSYSGSAASFTCYFCNENGHGQRDCPYIADLINKGVLSRSENGISLKDGSYIPKGDPSMTKKDRVLKVAQEKG